MGVTKQGNNKAWSPVSPRVTLLVTVPFVLLWILHAAILTHNKATGKVNCRFLLLWSLKLLQQKREKNVKPLLESRKGKRYSQTFWTDRTQGIGATQTNFQTIFLLPVPFPRMWRAPVIPYSELFAIKINAIGHQKKLQLDTDETLFPPGEEMWVKKLNVMGQPGPHPRVLYSETKYRHVTGIL